MKTAPTSPKSTLENSAMNDDSKRKKCIEMVSERKACRRCANCGLTNPSVVDNGKHDGSEIGPWTRWNGDLYAKVLVVGQEWGSTTSFIRQRGLDKADGDTNEMLVYLLASIGIDISDAPKPRPNSGVFLTNAALCLKEGNSQSKVKKQWFKNCGTAFLRRQIDLVQPRVVVALGKEAYQGICDAYEMDSVSKFSEAIGLIVPIKNADGIRMIPVSHCSVMARNMNNRPRSKQFRDWMLIKAALHD